MDGNKSLIRKGRQKGGDGMTDKREQESAFVVQWLPACLSFPKLEMRGEGGGQGRKRPG